MVKTVGVSSARHLKNVCAYLNDERVVAREGWNLGDPRVGRWEREMDRSRVAYGHDVPSKAGVKNTILYHQILAFNADDCRLNGRKKGMSGSDCMNYAREWCAREYPNQEVLLVLHKEHCEADGTDRWAVHLAVNRTDLATGKRYHAGPGHAAAAHRAKLARELDKGWGLKETVRGQRNSEVHHRQPSRTVKEIRARNEQPVFDFVRSAVSRALEPSTMRSLVQLKTELAKSGIALAQRANELYYKAQGYVFKGETIGFSRVEVQAVLNEREQVARHHHAASELRRTHEFVAKITQLTHLQPQPKREEEKQGKFASMPERRTKQHTRREDDRRHEQAPVEVEIEMGANLDHGHRGITSIDTTLNKKGIQKKYEEAWAKQQTSAQAKSKPESQPKHVERHRDSAVRRVDVAAAANAWVQAYIKRENALYDIQRAQDAASRAGTWATQADEDLSTLRNARTEMTIRSNDDEPSRWHVKEHKNWQARYDEAAQKLAAAEQRIKDRYGSESEAKYVAAGGGTVDMTQAVKAYEKSEAELAQAEKAFADAAYEAGWGRGEVYAVGDKLQTETDQYNSLFNVAERMEQRGRSDDLLHQLDRQHREPVHKSHEEVMREIQERRDGKAAASKTQAGQTDPGTKPIGIDRTEGIIRDAQAQQQLQRDRDRVARERREAEKQQERDDQNKNKGGRDDL